MIRNYPRARIGRQQGAVLFVSLILLLVLTLIGVTAAQMQTVEERMSLNDDNHQLALQSGEAVLRDSEARFYNGVYATDPATYPFDGTLGTATLALEAVNGSSIADASQSSFESSAVSYNGPTLSGVPVPLPYVLVENLPPVASNGDPIPANDYPVQMTTIRTTTIAAGADSTSNVVVQSVAYNAPND